MKHSLLFLFCLLLASAAYAQQERTCLGLRSSLIAFGDVSLTDASIGSPLRIAGNLFGRQVSLVTGLPCTGEERRDFNLIVQGNLDVRGQLACGNAAVGGQIVNAPTLVVRNNNITEERNVSDVFLLGLEESGVPPFEPTLVMQVLGGTLSGEQESIPAEVSVNGDIDLISEEANQTVISFTVPPPENGTTLADAIININVTNPADKLVFVRLLTRASESGDGREISIMSASEPNNTLIWENVKINLGNGLAPSNVVFLTSAGRFDIADTTVRGSVVAPFANMKLTNVEILGSLVANNITGTNVTIRGPTFRGGFCFNREEVENVSLALISDTSSSGAVKVANVQFRQAKLVTAVVATPVEVQRVQLQEVQVTPVNLIPVQTVRFVPVTLRPVQFHLVQLASVNKDP